MNRGFGFYFGNAIKSSARTLWHKGNLLKYFAWAIMELLSLGTVVLGATVPLANVRQAKIAERENVIDIPQSYKVACRAQPFWTMVLAIVLEALIFLAGIILIGIASALLGAVGYAVSLFVDKVAPGIIMLVFLAPGMLALLVYFIIMPMLFAPTAYVIETNPDIGAADAISICFNTMKSRGKGTLFLNYFIPALMEGAILGLGGAVEYVLLLFVGLSNPVLYLALAVLVGILFVVAFALIVPMFTLARKISNKSLFEDIVLDPVNASKRTSGVNIRKCKGVKFDPARYENELSMLFDETYSDRVPMPENPSAIKKRQLEERKAAREVSTVSADYVKPVAEEKPAYKPEPEKISASDEEDGELLTVSDLIRDVEVAEEPSPVAEEPAAAAPVAEEPNKAEPAAAEPEKVAEPVEAPAEEPAPPEPEKVEEPVKAEEPEPAEEGAKAEEPAAAPEHSPAKKTAAKSTATKPATKTTRTKKTAAKKSADGEENE